MKESDIVRKFIELFVIGALFCSAGSSFASKKRG